MSYLGSGGQSVIGRMASWLGRFIETGGSLDMIFQGQAELDFGASTQQGDTAIVTVLDTNVQNTSIILCDVAYISTADHEPEEAVIEDVNVAAGFNIVPGVSFDIYGYAPEGTHGKYKVNYIGVV